MNRGETAKRLGFPALITGNARGCGPTAPAVAAARGFTLIELAVVIVILGILAAFALPRFVTFSREARIAKLEAARGAVGSGAFLANSISLTQGWPPTRP